jgi:uncharacterized 2Fe-2S/4Fe-4S cluster protein (DUF4445 family)
VAEEKAVVVLPGGRRLRVRAGELLLFALWKAGIPVPSDCGGQGTCGRCRVQYQKDAPAPTPAERELLTEGELADGWRLACQHEARGEITIFVPALGTPFQAKVYRAARYGGPLRPQAKRRQLSLPPPGKEDQRDDLERLREAWGEELVVPPSLIAELRGALRAGEFRVTVTAVGPQLVSIAPGTPGAPLGLALDLGTSTLALYLVDLESGEEVSARAAPNPQGAFGPDVLSRISHVQDRGLAGLGELRERVVQGVNRLIGELVGQLEISQDDLVHMAVVGNPTMLHLFLGIDPTPIGVAPFVPAFRESLWARAKTLSLTMNPEGIVQTLPLVSGYVGADTVAGVLATGLHQSEELALFLDLGTNGEIVLGNKEGMVACSAAAGPAFEGGRIACGMPALAGAIAHLELDDDVHYETLGPAAPRGLPRGVKPSSEGRAVGGITSRGLCGTGLVDAVAGLLSVGLLDSRGRLRPAGTGPFSRRLEGEGKHRRFLIAAGPRPVFLTQGDVRELQLAKGAIRAGIEVLFSHFGVTAEEVARVYLAGAFGAEMRPESVARIGLLPEKLLPRTVPAGNAAGAGAKCFLLNREAAYEAEGIARRMEYVELSYEPMFSQKFARAMLFPHVPKEVCT